MNKRRIGLGLWLTSKVDSPEGQCISVHDICAHIEDGSVFDFLTARLGDSSAIAYLSEEQRAVMRREWQGMGAFDPVGNFGVSDCGPCLLIGYIFEALQHPPKH